MSASTEWHLACVIELWLETSVNAAVAKKKIMKIGGRKTRSVFDRYNIVDQQDVTDAASNLDRKAEQRMQEQRDS